MRKSGQPIPALLEMGMRVDVHWFPEDVSPSALAETFAAMANTDGGQILIGISPRTGKPQGIIDGELAIDQVFQAALLTDPPLVLPLPILETVDDKPILRVTIPTGLPYIYTVGGRYLGREGRHSTPIPPGALRRKLIERGVVQFEARVPPDAGLEDLERSQIEEYAARFQQGHGESPEDLLLRRGCLVRRGDRLQPTYAGLLLFGKHPQRWTPNALIMAARFAGTALSDSFIKQEVTGTLPQQLRATERFFRENLQSVVRLTGLTREEHPEYPPEAVRELLVNAVAHRDYSSQGDSIHLHIFSNRLEVHSPGLLPGPVTLANLLDARFSRNPVIVQVLSDLGFIERLGYGLDRVVKVMAENRLQSPSFQETAGTFRVTLSNAMKEALEAPGRHLTFQAKLKNLGLNERQEKAVAFLFDNERITNSDYQEFTPDVHPETLRRDLADLVKKQILLKIGSKRGTYYIMKEEF